MGPARQWGDSPTELPRVRVAEHAAFPDLRAAWAWPRQHGTDTSASPRWPPRGPHTSVACAWRRDEEAVHSTTPFFFSFFFSSSHLRQVTGGWECEIEVELCNFYADTPVIFSLLPFSDVPLLGIYVGLWRLRIFDVLKVRKTGRAKTWTNLWDHNWIGRVPRSYGTREKKGYGMKQVMIQDGDMRTIYDGLSKRRRWWRWFGSSVL